LIAIVVLFAGVLLTIATAPPLSPEEFWVNVEVTIVMEALRAMLAVWFGVQLTAPPPPFPVLSAVLLPVKTSLAI